MKRVIRALHSPVLTGDAWGMYHNGACVHKSGQYYLVSLLMLICTGGAFMDPVVVNGKCSLSYV